VSFDITREILTKNMGLKIISLLIGAILWLYVISITNPYVLRETQVRVVHKGLSDRLIIKNKLDNVSIVYKARRKDIIAGNNNIYAYIDLKGREDIGNINAEVIVFKPEEFEIIKRTPETIPVVLRQVYKTTMKIDYQLAKRTGYYYEILNKLPENVEISGDVDDVKNVFMSRVSVDMMRLSPGEHNLREKVTILGSDYNEIKNVKAEPDFINLYVKINNYPVEDKVVKPVIEGSAAEGFTIYSIDVNPSIVSIEGHPEVLNTMDFVNTEKINIDGLNKSMTKKVRLLRSDDYRYISFNEVEVIIVLKKEVQGE